MEKQVKLDVPDSRKLNHKKVFITTGMAMLILIVVVIVVIYYSSEEFRNFMDKYILRKDVTEENVPMIEIDYESNTNVIPYGKYICILAENTLFEYNSSGRKEKEVKIEVNTPVYDVEDKYLVIGEKNNQKLYLITGDHIVWEKNIEGNLNKVTVNKNGYVSAIISGTTYKSVIVTYDEKGNELFKSYLSNAIAVDACISPNNENLAYAEVNTSGTAIQSNIKVISMEEAKEKNTEPKYTYNADQSNLIIKIRYQDKNKLICMYEDSIHVMQNEQDTEILKLDEDEKKVTFADIELTDSVFRTIEQSVGLFQANTMIEIKNVNNEKENVYNAQETVKSIVSAENIIAVNFGTEVEFINTNGWLVKRYTSTQSVRNIVICDGVAGIIYRDKIELISL